jgi:hypothetical protein
MEQCLALSIELFDESNPNVLDIKRGLADLLVMTGTSGVARAGKLIEEIVEQTKKNSGEISYKYLDALSLQIYYFQLTGNVAAQRVTIRKCHEISKEYAIKNKVLCEIPKILC